MSTLAEKLADAWIKRDLIQLKSEELPKNREDSHAIQKQFHAVLKKKTGRCKSRRSYDWKNYR